MYAVNSIFRAFMSVCFWKGVSRNIFCNFTRCFTWETRIFASHIIIRSLKIRTLFSLLRKNLIMISINRRKKLHPRTDHYWVQKLIFIKGKLQEYVIYTKLITKLFFTCAFDPKIFEDFLFPQKEKIFEDFPVLTWNNKMRLILV